MDPPSSLSSGGTVGEGGRKNTTAAAAVPSKGQDEEQIGIDKSWRAPKDHKIGDVGGRGPGWFPFRKPDPVLSRLTRQKSNNLAKSMDNLDHILRTLEVGNLYLMLSLASTD